MEDKKINLNLFFFNNNIYNNNKTNKIKNKYLNEVNKYVRNNIIQSYGSKLSH